MTWQNRTAVVDAPAKVNWSLHIVGRRSDGYHLLDSIVTPISLCDRLTVRVAASDQSRIALSCGPAGAAPSGAENLAARAAALFLRRHLPAAVTIDLIKQIPAGAGLGGGSSDAAAVLRALNALCPEPVSAPTLAAWGLELGADVPLFLFGGPARVRGIGEILDPCPVPTEHPLVVCFPGIAMATRDVYAKYDDSLTIGTAASSIRALTPGQGPLRFMMHNDLEVAAFHLQPSLRSLKQRFVALGAAATVMTGSGSAIFGAWTEWSDAQGAAEQLTAAGMWARVVRVLGQVPAVELDPS
jgi:4-diphosphocytidyl-2-C-methyl-D-erythritol kinase